MRKQIELRLYFGAETLPQAFVDHMIAAASRLCGGCFVADGSGYWIESDGPRRAATFQGKLAQEETLCLAVTTEPAKTEIVLNELQDATLDAVRHTGAAVNWVHVQQSEIMGRHFSVAQALQDADRVAA